MQLLKSLFCLQGFDNRTRFFTIYSAVFIIFIILASASSSNLILSFVVLALFSAILALASLRRLHDAKLNKNWLFAPSISFIITALFIIFSGQHASYYLLIIPVLCCSVLLTYPSKKQKEQNHILGYIGPVDLSEYQQAAHQGKTAKFRIEPSLAGEHSVNIDSQEQSFQQTYSNDSFNNSSQSAQVNPNHVDVGELIRLKLLNNKKAQIAIISLVVVVLAAVFTSWLISFLNTASPDSEIDKAQTQPQVISEDVVREHPLEMPDNFTLFLSEHQGIIINWQADEVNNNRLWSQRTAQGDESCTYISFNKGNPIRTLNVEVEKLNGINSNYFASFSPLDSQALVQALAFRGKFTLCGYDFSLKGSQAALGKNKYYADWVSY